MPERKDDPYYIRDYQPGDETAITTLFGLVFGQVLTEAHWRWKYLDASSAPPVARLAFNAEGELVGHAGAIFLRGWRQGRSLPFFQICDVMVHPAARGQLGKRNLFTQLVRELLEGLAGRWPTAFAYGFPGRRPFRLGEYARVYGAVERASSLHRAAQKALGSWLSVHPLKWDDPRLDALWDRCAPELPLALVRDRAYLNWRYATHPFRRYQLFGLSIRLNLGLLGWVVIQQEEHQLRVIDLLIPRHLLNQALIALERLAADRGAHELEIWLPPGWREEIPGRVESTEVVVANMIWRLPIPTGEVQRNLYYTMGDLDIF